MSGSKGAQPLTPQKKEILQSLLARAGIHHEEAEPSTPSDFFLVDLQSMSDAPKRQSDDLGNEQAPKRMFAIDVPSAFSGWKDSARQAHLFASGCAQCHHVGTQHHSDWQVHGQAW